MKSIFNCEITLSSSAKRHIVERHVKGTGSKFSPGCDWKELIRLTLQCGNVVKWDKHMIVLALHTPFLLGISNRDKKCYVIRVVINRLRKVITAFPAPCPLRCQLEHSAYWAESCISRHLINDGLYRPCTCGANTHFLQLRTPSKEEMRIFKTCAKKDHQIKTNWELLSDYWF